MKLIEKGAPATAIIAALSSILCCLPFGIVGAIGLAGVGAWISWLRPWLLGAAVVLLLLGFWQLYRRRNQCSRRSAGSIALFWVAVAVVLLVALFPQLLANLMAG